MASDSIAGLRRNVHVTSTERGITCKRREEFRSRSSMRNAIFLLANIGVVLAEVVLVPSNTVVIRGEEMKMTCLTSNNSRVRKWNIFTTKLETLTIYSFKKFHRLFEHFGVDADSNGSGQLYTNSTNLSDAGIYKCLSVTDGQDKEYSAQLTVLESMPNCEESLALNSSQFLSSGDYIWMQCKVNFRGFWIPTMEWIEYGDHLGPEGRSVTERVDLTRISNRSVTSNLTILIDINSSRNGSRFVCKIYFGKYDGKYNMSASNVPTFNYTWNSSVITLLYISSTESVSTEVNTDGSSTVHLTSVKSSSVPGKSPVTDWFLISLSLVAALSVFFIIIIILVVTVCIRFKKKLSAQYASASMSEKVVETPMDDGGYDILPYATSDNYDMIDDTLIDTGLKIFFRPRQGPLPTPGYSSLTSTEPIAPGVYSRMDPYEKPVDIPSEPSDMKDVDDLIINSEEQTNDSRTIIGERERNHSPNRPYIDSLDIEADDPETLSEKCVDDSQKKRSTIENLDLRKGVTQSSVHSYMELFDGAVPDNPVFGERVDDCVEKTTGIAEGYLLQEGDRATIHSYIELTDIVEADISNEYKRTSDSDIPSSYITVNF